MSGDRLTRRQAIILRALSGPTRTPMSARTLHTRSDLLWRLEERGMVQRNAHQQWRILPAGERALEDYTREQVDRMIPASAFTEGPVTEGVPTEKERR